MDKKAFLCASGHIFWQEETLFPICPRCRSTMIVPVSALMMMVAGRLAEAPTVWQQFQEKGNLCIRMQVPGHEEYVTVDIDGERQYVRYAGGSS